MSQETVAYRSIQSGEPYPLPVIHLNGTGAEEWIGHNVMGVQCNGKGFIVLYDYEDMDISGATETSPLT